MKDAAKRKRDERQRKRSAGLVPKEIWVLPSEWHRIEKYLNAIARRRK